MYSSPVHLFSWLPIQRQALAILPRVDYPIRSDQSSRLRDVNRLADHQTAMKREHEHNRVELKDGTLRNEAEGNVLVGPALGNPVGHEGDDR